MFEAASFGPRLVSGTGSWGPAPPRTASPLVRWYRDALTATGLASNGTDYVKRVIGLPGETVQGHDGHVFVDGRRLVEPYLPAGAVTEDFGPVTLPPEELWVMGDNRLNSEDSTRFGPVRRADIIGRAIAKIWPPGSQEFL